jgi:hypothetical protein
MSHMLEIDFRGFGNDVAACYDYLLKPYLSMNMMGVAFECMGILEGPLCLQEDGLLNVIHHLKTTFSITINSYTSNTIF